MPMPLPRVDALMSRVPARRLIAAFGLCLIVAAWASVLILTGRERNEEIGRAYRQNAALARSFEEHVRRALQTADSALSFLKVEYEKHGAVTASMRDYVDRLRGDPTVNQLAVADAAGNLLLSAVPSRKPVNIAAREHFRVHRSSDAAGLFVGKPVVTLVSGTWSFFLSRRIAKPDGSFAGTVSAGLDPSYFSRYYGAPELGSERAVLLVGRDHIVRARHFRNDTSVGQDLRASPLFDAVKRHPAGSYAARGVTDGLPRFASYRAMPDYPLLVVVSVLQDAALAPFERRRALGFLAGGVFTVFVAAFCALLIRADRRDELRRDELQRELGERRRAEESLRESKGLFEAFMNHMPGVAFLKDDEGQVLYTNEAFRQLFGEKLVGRSTRDLPGVDPAVRDAMQRDDARALAEGTLVLEEQVGGRVFETRKFAVCAEGKRPLLGGVSVDITERREAERERLALERRLQQTQKTESLGVLAGGIAHDFNNLLMGIVGNLDLALAKAPPASALRPYLERADQAAQRAAELTSQMLAYSGKGRFVVGLLDLSLLVEELLPLLATVLSKRAEVRRRLARDLPPVEADASQLRQVVMNLVTNASDALQGGDGTVEVETGAVDLPAAFQGGGSDDLPPGRYVYLAVTDSGCGMAPETRARMFEPFFTTKQTGRGLGLAAVVGIVRGHHGSIDVRSEPGRGTSFRVFLPAAAGAAGAAGAAEGPGAREAGGGEAPWRGRGAVLLADDEESVRETAAAMLEACGFEVVTASDGVEALEAFRTGAGAFAAVILDLTMPRMGGAEACRELRRIAPRVPVLLSSGYTADEVAPDCEGVSFVHKPYRLQELAGTIREALAEAEKRSG